MTPLQQTLSQLWSGSTLLLSLMILAGLAGCGPVSSDNEPNLGTRTSVNGTALSQQSSSASNKPMTPVTQAASPVTIASGSETGGASGKETVPEGGKLPIPSLPDSIAKDLGSPDAHARYRALDYWKTKATRAPLDPLFEALEDDNPAVRADAAAIVEQYVAKQQEQAEG